MLGEFDVSPLEHYITEPLRVVEALVSEIDTSFSVPIVIYLNSILKMCQEGQFFYCPCCWAEVFSVILPR